VAGHGAGDSPVNTVESGRFGEGAHPSIFDSCGRAHPGPPRAAWLGTRVWWNDLEADVVDGNHVYEWAIAGWAAISVGAFEPGPITEAWQAGAGPVTVSFELAGEPQTLNPAFLDDWIDPMILTDINAMIAGSGRQFRLFKAFGQDAYVLALTAEEQTALEARGWCFE
jgi:hypothetical protein